MHWETLKTPFAVFVTFPLFIVVIRRAFLAHLTDEERGLIRAARGTTSGRRVAFAAVGVGIVAIVTAPSSSAPSGPYWAWVASWIITWPLIAFAFARWSLDLRDRDYQLWVQAMRGKVVELRRVSLYLIAAILPGILLMLLASTLFPTPPT